MTEHCNCCICKRNNLSTNDKLQVIVDENNFELVDELLTGEKVIDMKKLFYFIKARYERIDCDALHYFTDVSESEIQKISQLFSEYVMFQISVLSDFEHDEIPEDVYETLEYMFDTNAVFVLNNILHTTQQKELFVNCLINKYFIYKAEFQPYVSNETISKLVEFHR